MPELSEAGAAEGFEVIGFAERRAGKPEAATLSEFAHTLRVGLGFREQPLVGVMAFNPKGLRWRRGKCRRLKVMMTSARAVYAPWITWPSAGSINGSDLSDISDRSRVSASGQASARSWNNRSNCGGRRSGRFRCNAILTSERTWSDHRQWQRPTKEASIRRSREQAEYRTLASRNRMSGRGDMNLRMNQ